jgi:hypothetical protein
MFGSRASLNGWWAAPLWQRSKHDGGGGQIARSQIACLKGSGFPPGSPLSYRRSCGSGRVLPEAAVCRRTTAAQDFGDEDFGDEDFGDEDFGSEGFGRLRLGQFKTWAMERAKQLGGLR